MKIKLLLIVFVFLTSCGGQNEPTTNIDEPMVEEKIAYTILALGDSLTEGLGVVENLSYPAQLQKKLKTLGYKGVKVVNAGLSGETTSGLKNRLNWVLKQQPDLTILNIGANDAMRGLPLDLTTNNIEEIINTILENDSELIIAGMQIYDNLGQEYVKGFKGIYPELAKNYELTMIPFFLQHVAGDANLNQADMIHPNAKGYKVIVEKNILPILLKTLPKSLKEGTN